MLKLFQQVTAYINAPETAAFESLALAVFRYQAAHVPMYRAYLARLNIDPRTVGALEDIPPVSTLAYKYARIENELHPQSPASRVFLTSGTTIGPTDRGRHLVPAAEIYRVSAINHLRRMLFPDGARLAMLALHPTAARMPESSLAQMISWCIEEFGEGSTLCTATRDSVDLPQSIEFLRAAERSNRPVCILGTTASCAALFVTVRAKGPAIRLPGGSRLMDTGGAKGQRVPLSPQQVVAEAHKVLGIEPALVINEYGMTEMCSQLYDATRFNSGFESPPGMRLKLAPPWLRPAALNPVTLKPSADGVPGMLAFFDLANVGSISALLTEDVGFVQGLAVMVLGRSAAADPRGCALAIKQFAQASAPLTPPHPQIIPLSQQIASKPLLANVQLTAKAEAGYPVHAGDLEIIAARLRQELATQAAPNPDMVGAICRKLMEAVQSESGHWPAAVREIAASSGSSESLLSVSLAALLKPLSGAADLARKVRPRRELLGFIMPGNVPGAGIHELITALAAGCAAIVKTSSSEPVFFRQLAATLSELKGSFGSELSARLEVLNWTRERSDLTEALLKNCDRVIAFGDDLTIDQLQRLGRPDRLIGFGNRLSGAAVMRGALQSGVAQTADAIALDCAMFDQLGCLSPHHIFVEQHARQFAAELAAAFSRLTPLLCAKKGSCGTSESLAAVRRVREMARWRRLSGQNVELWEDPCFNWTVVLDDAASFTPSPGFRTVFVSAFGSPSDLENRLEPVRGRIEAFAIAACSNAGHAAGARRGKRPATNDDLAPLLAIVERCGASYVCAPGEIQSPPLDWPHGGSEFIHLFIGYRPEPPINLYSRNRRKDAGEFPI